MKAVALSVVLAESAYLVELVERLLQYTVWCVRRDSPRH